MARLRYKSLYKYPHYLRKEMEMFKKQKKQVFVFGIVVILSISLATPISKAALDIDWIAITSSKNFLDGLPKGTEPWCFKIQVQVADTGNLHHINVTEPGSSTPFTLDPGPGGYWDLWPPPEYPSLSDLRGDYPEGIYTFEFLDIDDVLVKTVNLDYNGIPGPPESPVDFTYPSFNGQMGISTNPTFTWTVDSSAGDALMLGLRDVIIDDEIYWDDIASITTTSWTPGSLLAGRAYELDVYLINVKNLESGPAFPTMIVDGDQFEYALMIEYLNEITFTTAPTDTLSGLVWMVSGSDFGYSLEEGNFVYFLSLGPVWYYNFTTGLWDSEGPAGLVYVDWPFMYEIATGSLWFVLPPVSGLWVYHFSTSQWEFLPRIIP